MFQTYFDLKRRPFASVPSPEDYYPGTSVESARASLVRLIEREEGPAIVVGQVGIGKSLLCQLLAESFRHLCRTVVLPSGRLCTRRSLLQVILYELGLPYRDLDEGELRLTLIDHITNRSLCPSGVLLLVDEADSLTMTLLDELRTLTNLTVDNQPCVRLVLFGTPRLEEKFAHPRLESFNQRLAGRFYLEPFKADETREYIESRIRECGAAPDEVFTPDAYSAVQRATGGIPRLINQVSDHALVLSAADDRLVVDASSIEEAWADLQQLPAPFERGGLSSRIDFPADIIEFGELDSSMENIEQRAERHLSEIASHLDDADQDTNDFHPVLAELEELEESDALPESTPAPEVTLYFHPAHNPFGDDFDEEEVVVDRFTDSNPSTRSFPNVDQHAEPFPVLYENTEIPATPESIYLGDEHDALMSNDEPENDRNDLVSEETTDSFDATLLTDDHPSNEAGEYSILSLDLVDAFEDAIQVDALNDSLGGSDACDYLLGEHDLNVINVAAVSEDCEAAADPHASGDEVVVTPLVLEQLGSELNWPNDPALLADHDEQSFEQSDSTINDYSPFEGPSLAIADEMVVSSPKVDQEVTNGAENEPPRKSQVESDDEFDSNNANGEASEQLATATATVTTPSHDYRRLFTQLRRNRR